jgi:hypothetical protein
MLMSAGWEVVVLCGTELDGDRTGDEMKSCLSKAALRLFTLSVGEVSS